MNKDLPNIIAFNGLISSDFFDVGGGCVAFNLLAGGVQEMPLFLANTTMEEISSRLQKDDDVSGYGNLKRVQGQWIIEIQSIMKNPKES